MEERFILLISLRLSPGIEQNFELACNDKFFIFEDLEYFDNNDVLFSFNLLLSDISFSSFLLYSFYYN